MYTHTHTHTHTHTAYIHTYYTSGYIKITIDILDNDCGNLDYNVMRLSHVSVSNSETRSVR